MHRYSAIVHLLNRVRCLRSREYIENRRLFNFTNININIDKAITSDNSCSTYCTIHIAACSNAHCCTAIDEHHKNAGKRLKMKMKRKKRREERTNNSSVDTTILEANVLNELWNFSDFYIKRWIQYIFISSLVFFPPLLEIRNRGTLLCQSIVNSVSVFLKIVVQQLLLFAESLSL